MAKITLPTISSGYLSTEALNQAFSDIAEAFDNTLSRDGSTPNQMEADLDLNGYVLLNSGSSDDPDSMVSRSAMEDYVDERAAGLLLQRTERQVAVAAQTVFTLTEFEYEPETGNIAVYVDGLRKFQPTDYVEDSATTITFVTPMAGGEVVQVVQTDFLATISLASHSHPWSQITGAPVYTTRWADWAEVTGKPTVFTPDTHVHAAADITSGRLADARRGVYVQATQPTANTVGELWAW
jgi:hypothetical protein